jgi:hypothetical protein
VKTARFIKEQVSPVGAVQRLYQLSEPIAKYGADGDSGPYVIVSGVWAMFSGPETYIFPADATGKVTDWGELEGSFRGSIDHERALRAAGYDIVPEAAS